MKKLVPSLVSVFILIVNANAQIQKTAHNRVFTDEDYEYTEAERLKRDVKAQMEQGMSFYKAGNYTAAVDAYGLAASLDPSSFTAQHNLGVMHLNLRDLAWSYLDLKKYPEAIEALKECERLDSQRPTTYLAMAEAYFGMKRLNEALGYAQQAAQLSPELRGAYVAMGSIYFEMNKMKDAKRVFEKALSMQPESGSARYNLAMTCLALNQKDCAREQYAILKTFEPVLSSRLLDQIYSSKVIQLLK